MKKINKKWLILGVVGVVFLGFIFWPKDSAAAYEVINVKRGKLATYFSFSGNVVAGIKDNYIAVKETDVKEYKVKTGDFVEIGDLLYTIDDTDLKPTLNQAEAALKSAKNNFNSTKASIENQIIQAESSYNLALSTQIDAEKALNRYKQLYEIGGVSQIEVESMEKSFNQAKVNADNALMAYTLLKDTTGPINISNAQNSLISAQASYDLNIKQIGEINVHAEIAGEITYTASNKHISNGNTILTITNFDSLNATINVDEYDISSIEVGKEAEVYVSSLETSIKGTVSNLSKNAKAGSGISFFSAEVSFPKTEHVLEGMSVEVKILNKNSDNALILPMKAINFNDLNEPFVYIKDGKKIITKNIKIGISDGINAEITEGLDENQNVYYTVGFNNMMMSGGGAE